MTTRIKLTFDYRGWKTQERVIPAGEYDINAPALHGAGPYLVEQRFAEIISAPVAPAVQVTAEPPPPADIPPTDLDSESDETPEGDEPTEDLDGEPVILLAMTVDELEEYADSIGLDPTTVKGTGASGNVLKADLVAAITAHEASLQD